MGKITTAFRLCVCRTWSSNQSLYTSRRLMPSSWSSMVIFLARSLSLISRNSQWHRIRDRPSKSGVRIDVWIPVKCCLILLPETVHCVVHIVNECVHTDLVTAVDEFLPQMHRLISRIRTHIFEIILNGDVSYPVGWRRLPGIGN